MKKIAVVFLYNLFIISNLFAINTPALYSPSTGTVLSNAASVELNWYQVSGTTGYELEVDTTSGFNSPLYTLYNSCSYLNGKAYVRINPLRYGTTYYWRVRAVNSNTNETSNYSAVWTFTTSSCPTLYSPSNGTTLSNAASVELNWYQISGTARYELEVDTTSRFDSPVYTLYNSCSYLNGKAYVSINPLMYGTTYYWRVRAINATGSSNWSSVWHFTTSSCPTLYSPSNGTTLSNAASVELNWYQLSGTTGYELEVDTTRRFDSPVYALYNSCSYLNGKAYVYITSLLSGTTYYWRVRALNAIDTSAWSYVWRFTTAYQLTTAPTLVSPANGSTEIAPSGVELVWDGIDNVTGYRYQVATDNAFASIVRSGTTAGTSVSCNLMYGTTYYWRVQGYNASGNSVWSAVWNFSTQDCQQPTGETSATACSSYQWHGTTYTESGNYTITLPQSNGCDSVLTLHLTINQPLAELVEATACDSYEWNGETYTESGTYEKTFTAFNGCDSVVTLHLTINHPLAEQVEATACNSYEWNGETYTESGTYEKTFTASNGCDSIVTLHLTINHPLAEFVEAEACDSYEWNGETYTESGTYDKTFTASNGCDSVVTLHLTINHPLAEQVEATACNSYEWNGETYTESGTYDKTFTASNGCDSVVTLHLTINESVQYSFTETATSPYIWNGTEYTETGDYTQNFTSANGCDSIVTLHLNILSGISQNGTAEISIYPNPATDILNITSSETISEIEIVNEMGQVVKRIEANSDNAVCDVNELKAGVYMVRIRSAKSDTSTTFSVRRFVKE